MCKLTNPFEVPTAVAAASEPVTVFLPSVPSPLVPDGQGVPVLMNTASARPMQDVRQRKYAPSNVTVSNHWRATVVVRLSSSVASADNLPEAHASPNSPPTQHGVKYHLALCMVGSLRCTSSCALGSMPCTAAGPQPMFCVAPEPVDCWGSAPGVPEGNAPHLALARPQTLMHAVVHAPGPAPAKRPGSCKAVLLVRP